MKLQKSISALLAGTVIAASGISGLANAASSEESRYTHSACEGADAVCGVIVMGNAGVYTLDWVSVNAKSSQASTGTHPSCAGLDKKLTANVPAANYDTFVLPASCAYKLKIKILSGNNKDKNLYLTPGCQIIAKVDGTVSSNSWKTLEISKLSSQVPTNGDGKPVDAEGHKCGKLSGAGI
ncbi:MAG: hypothetical protein AAF437_06915 [Pseudomonadota bacterium]